MQKKYLYILAASLWVSSFVMVFALLFGVPTAMKIGQGASFCSLCILGASIKRGAIAVHSDSTSELDEESSTVQKAA